MIESNLQIQIEKQKRIKKILFILRMFLMFCAIDGLAVSIFFFILSKELLIPAIIFLIVDIVFVQWSTSYRILSFSSVLFMRKNKILLITYNTLTLNILGIILTNKFLKNDNYNCLNLVGKNHFETNQTNNKASYHINEALYYHRRLTILIEILTIIFAFAYIWSYKYMKYLNNHKTEWINVQAYNRLLFNTDFLMYIFGKTKRWY